MYIAAPEVLIDHIIIKYLFFLIILIILPPLEQDILDLLPPLRLAAVQIVQPSLDEQLVEVHLEGSPFQNMLHYTKSTSSIELFVIKRSTITSFS